MLSTRKIISGLVLLLVGVAVTFVKGDIPSNLLSLMECLYSAFVLGNFGEHASKAFVASKQTDKPDAS